MIKNNIQNNLNSKNKFLSLSFDQFIVDIRIEYKNFYEKVLYIQNNRMFDLIFSNLLNLISHVNINQKLYISVLLTNDKQIAKINMKSRKKSNPTNILSFPSNQYTNINNKLNNNDGNEIFCGDIVISIERITDEAIKQKKKLIDHFLHIFIHGLLHLFGFDHKTNKQANTMEYTEAKILNHIGIKDPYL